MSLAFRCIYFILFCLYCEQILHCQSNNDFNFKFSQVKKTKNPTFNQFIDNLKLEEEKYALDDQNKPGIMITRLRKLFYDSPAFDKYLITNVNTIKPSYRQVKQINRTDYTRNISTKSGLHFSIDDVISVPVDSQCNYISMRTDLVYSQEVSIDSTTIVDIGHLLCGLDASNHPSVVSFPFPLRFIKVQSNMDAITWIGDLGSVVSEYYYLKKSKRSMLSKNQIQNLIDEYASPADNLGNIHAYVLADFLGNKTQYSKVSDLLENFYLQKGELFSSCYENSYLIFAKSIGLVWEGNRFKNIEQMKNKYARQVSHAAAMYLAVAAKRKGNWNLIVAFPSILKLSKLRFSKIIVEKFFESLQNEINKKKYK